ncbi:MAG: phosphopyruvate hydratase [bacterium]
MTTIELIAARQILDSRGMPTIEVDILCDDGTLGRASVPSGASTGTYEALELRDGDPSRYSGKSVENAINNIIEIIAPQICGQSVYEQTAIDRVMINMDGSPNKSNLGANSILGVSIAVSYAGASSLGLPLYAYLGGINGRFLPVPFLNVINGGAHADNNLDIQEFMLIPVGLKSFKDALRASSEIYQSLKKELKSQGLSTSVGDEGGFAPNLKSNKSALDILIKAIEMADYKAGSEIFIGIDCAASEFYKNNKYLFEGSSLNSKEMVDVYEDWVSEYPILSIEDGLSEDDWEGWRELTERLGDRIQIVGDDIFVTNPERFMRGINEGIANAILIKPNQIGTLTETLEVIEIAKSHNYNTVISHRSGETEDTYITDIAVGINLLQIKIGAPARGERVAKYNNLLRIEEELGDRGIYAGKRLMEKWCR